MTAISSRRLVVELVTEELPPKALAALGAAFAESIRTTLQDRQLVDPPARMQVFATPRRLALSLDDVRGQAPDQPFAEKLMPAHIGLDAQGNATAALHKKLQARGLGDLHPGDLVRRNDGKQDILYAEGTSAGARLADGLQQALDQAITHLPIPKVMQYQLADGHTSVKFVRPAHRLLALWGTDIVPVHILGLQAGRTTSGHRFMSEGPIDIPSAGQWATLLQDQGRVIPGFEARRAEIARQIDEAEKRLGATVGEGADVDALLDEVTALVEHPTVYVGAFEESFLAVPQECLILTMRLNQKYFPLFDPASGRLTPRFLIVSNMRPQDPHNIIAGNQRVVRPRLADARFFYETDLKTPLASRVEGLAQRVYHNRLGSQLERTQRIQHIARWLAPLLGEAPEAAARAAWLALADLSSQMVGEFPELQGVMGAYYAAHDGEPAAICTALRNQYQIHLDSPVTGDTLTATILFMAERAETLAGIWGIGQAPTGERDPYGLRRAALGLISAYEQLTAGGQLAANEDTPANLQALLAEAVKAFPAGTLADGTAAEVVSFIYERYRNQLTSSDNRQIVDAVLAVRPPIHQVLARVRACAAFIALPEAEALAAANKRVANLLRKATGALPAFDAALLAEPAEKNLAATLSRLAPRAASAMRAGDFTEQLALLAQARDAVDAFFTEVMVMVDDDTLRGNRLALLRDLHALMNQVADLSRLAR